LSSTSEEAAERIAALLRERPLNFYAILQSLGDVEYRTILAAWGTLHEQDALARDREGNYVLRAGR
jgi:hypothetical protein